MVKELSVGSGLDSLGFSLLLIAMIVTCGWSPHCNFEKINGKTEQADEVGGMRE